MSRGIGTPENREMAFRVYARFGGRNIPGILERLKKEHGLRISAQTLYQWKRDGEWAEKLLDSGPSFEEGVLLKLMGLIERFERHLQTAPRMDAQAIFAYTNMINTFFNLSDKLRPFIKTDPARMKRIADEILENDYGIKRQEEGPFT